MCIHCCIEGGDEPPCIYKYLDVDVVCVPLAVYGGGWYVPICIYKYLDAVCVCVYPAVWIPAMMWSTPAQTVIV